VTLSAISGYERGMQEGLDLRDSLRERLGDREQDLKILDKQLRELEDALLRYFGGAKAHPMTRQEADDLIKTAATRAHERRRLALDDEQASP
jgi:triphosphoribosyl-dephospho-CoA synthetase